MKDPVFENYDYAQKGRNERKSDVSNYPEKVIRQLETTIRRLRNLH
jgi:hypothetical protein